MGTSNYSDEVKQDTVYQITVRGYPVREVARRLGVISHSLYKWLKLFGEPVANSVSVDPEAENPRLKRELARVTEERDIQRKQRWVQPVSATARLKVSAGVWKPSVFRGLVLSRKAT